MTKTDIVANLRMIYKSNPQFEEIGHLLDIIETDYDNGLDNGYNALEEAVKYLKVACSEIDDYEREEGEYDSYIHGVHYKGVSMCVTILEALIAELDAAFMTNG